MSAKYREFTGLNLPALEKEVLERWSKEKTFEQSISHREGKPAFVFYEGPPSANGMPGIHHVISRTLKDLVCRYQTMRGFQVDIIFLAIAMIGILGLITDQGFRLLRRLVAPWAA